MSARLSLAKPKDGEFDPASAGYIAAVPEMDDAVGRLTKQRDAVSRMLTTVSAAQAAFRYAPGKWSVREVAGHIADVERVMSYRLLRFARGDETPLPGFDENTYVPASAAEVRAMEALVDEWVAVRNATIALVTGLPASAWNRHGTANGKHVTTAALAYIVCGHVEHHIRLLRERYNIVSGR